MYKDQRVKVHIIDKHVYHQSDMQIQAFIMKNGRIFRYDKIPNFVNFCDLILWLQDLKSNMTANACLNFWCKTTGQTIIKLCDKFVNYKTLIFPNFRKSVISNMAQRLGLPMQC